jgi:hypothetical protein
MTNHRFSFTISIDAKQEKVWQELISVENWPSWDTELISAQLKGDFDQGATGTMLPKTGPKLRFRISDYKALQSYVIHTDMPVGHLIIERKLNLKYGKTLFTDEIYFTGFLKYVFGFFLGRSFKRVLPEVMENFKRTVETK